MLVRDALAMAPGACVSVLEAKVLCVIEKIANFVRH